MAEAEVRLLTDIRDALYGLTAEVHGVRLALEAGGATADLEPDSIVCPHCGNSDPEKLEQCSTTDAPGRWFCKNTACAKSFTPDASVTVAPILSPKIDLAVSVDGDREEFIGAVIASLADGVRAGDSALVTALEAQGFERTR